MTGTAADYIAATLEKAGVKRVFGVVGDSLNGFTDLLRERGKIDWIHVRHEEAAAFAAGAEAQLTGATDASAPGAAAREPASDQRPLRLPPQPWPPSLAIAAHIPSTEIGIGLLPGDSPGQPCSASAATTASLASTPSRCPACWNIAIRTAVEQAAASP